MQTTTYHPVYQQIHHIKKDADSPPTSNVDAQELANKMANLYAPRPEEGDALKDFAVSKNDPKYQTLPYNTKFTVNLLPSRMSKNENGNVNSTDHKEDVNNHISNHVNGNFNLQSTHMTVHSAPLSMVNKNIATPLNQHDLLSRKVSDNKEHGLLNGGEEPASAVRENAYPSTITTSYSGTTYQVSGKLLILTLFIVKLKMENRIALFAS